MRHIFIFGIFLFATISHASMSEKLCRKSFSPEDVLPATATGYQYFSAKNATDKTIVLIHGLGGSAYSWRYLAPELSQHFNVLTYDVRGHGATEPAGNDYSSTLLSHDLKVLIKHLNIKQAHLLGWSMGGRIALRFAHLFPELTAGVIIEDMHAKGLRKFAESIPFGLKIYEQSLNREIFFDSEEELHTFLSFRFGHEIPEEYMRNNVRRENNKYILQPRAGAGSLAWSSQGLGEDLTDALIGIQAPLLFLAGDPQEKSTVLFDVGIQHIQKNKPSAQIEIVKNAGHGIHVDEHATFMRLVKEFVSKP